MENCILYDWLTVSFQNVDKDTLIHLLGMDTQPWQEQENGSRLRYGHRISFDGISVHYTDDHDLKHNQGICLEMSGQGCRDFETFGKKDWWLLFEFIRLTKGKVTRLDIAYDDFQGLIPNATNPTGDALPVYHSSEYKCCWTCYHGKLIYRGDPGQHLLILP